MVTSITSVTTPRRLTPYITTDMFKTHVRAGVQVDNLVLKGTDADQEAALAGYIEEAGSWVDDHAEQIFAATLDTVIQQVNVSRDGFVEIHPRYIPVIGLTDFRIGSAPDNMTALTTLAGAACTADAIHVPVYPLALTSSQGPIQFGGIGVPWDQAWAQYTYVNGYPVTLLTADLAAGATSIPVADTTGIVANKTYLTIYSGRTRHRVLATSVSTADAGGIGTGPGTVGCAVLPTAIDNPDVAVMVSALLPSLITANVLVTRALIKQKTPSTAGRGKEKKTAAGDDFEEAWELVSRSMQVAVTT